MPSVTRLVLDVLKPHEPNVLEFAKALSATSGTEIVEARVEAIDAKTESVMVTLQGENMIFEAIVEAVESMGGSLHSIDEVRVCAGMDELSS